MPVKNIRLVVSYDGTDYFGFQSQPGGNTIQDILEKAILRVSGEKVAITGSGRTDAGVHSWGQTINFQINSPIPAEKWRLVLNTRLPESIVVRHADEVPLAFNARKDAKRKTYLYQIQTNKVPNVFQRRFQFHQYRTLDLPRMMEAASHLSGTHDFTSFCAPKTTKENKVRTVYNAWWEQEENLLKFYIQGSGFLYNMVRIIVGTLIEVGEGKTNPDEIPAILAGCDRSLAGPTVPPHGLTLWEVNY